MKNDSRNTIRGKCNMLCRKCKKEIPDKSTFCNHCGAAQIISKKPRRRGNGEGTAYKRGSSWCCEKTFGYSEDNKRIFAAKYGFKTKKDALAYIPQLRDPRIKKLPRGASPSITLKQLYDLWLPTHNAGESTIGCYTAAFKVFRSVWYNKMEEMDIDDLQECMDEYVPKKGSTGKRTLENAKTALGLVYKYGMPRGYVPQNASGRPNLAEFLKVNADSGEHRTGFSADELKIIKRSIGKVLYADYIYCACYLGFRPSAFLQIDVKDYDRKQKAITGGIKTEAGINRIVTISPKIQSIINDLAENKIAGALFSKTDGSFFRLKDFREAFYVALSEMGIDNPVDESGRHRLTPHACRHTFATFLKRVKAPDKDKLELIGHTSEEMLRHYQDVSLEDLRKITDAL